MSYTVGVDVGTSGTKTLLVDEGGKVVASATAEYPLHSPRLGWAEQDPKDWWDATLKTLQQVVQSAGVPKDQIVGIGLTGQMHGSVFLDRDNEVLRPAILWCDQRTAKECEEITASVGGREQLIKEVSNPALTGFTAPKILWLRNNEPKLYERVTKVLLPKDYIRFKLTGEFATEVSDASGTLLFDVPHRKWSDRVLAKLGIPKNFMPRVVESPEITGKLSRDVAARVGLKPGTPVVGGGGDQAAGAVGNGIVKRGVVSSTIGTSGVVFAFTDEVVYDPLGRIHTFCHAVPGKWHVMGVMLSAGGSLQWFRNVLAGAEMEVARLAGRDPYEFITAEAEKVPAGAEGLLFLPYLTGERTPHADPFAKGVFFGLSLRHNKAYMARAILEGVTYGLRDSFEIFRERKIPIKEVRISGGGARSRLWAQINADVIGVPMSYINVSEGPAYGAALLAAVGGGIYGSVEEACENTIKVVSKIKPNPKATKSYDKYYKVFRELYQSLKPHFAEVAHLVESHTEQSSY